MKTWWPVGIGLCLVAGTIALRLLRYFETITLRRLMKGRHLHVTAGPNTDKRYCLIMAVIVTCFSVLMMPVKDVPATVPFLVNIFIALGVMGYWFNQPDQVRVFRSIYSR